MSAVFKLSGLGDVFLENTVHEAVVNAGYPDQELSDARESEQYKFFDLICGLDNIEQKLPELKQMAILTPDLAIPHGVANIKARLKKVFARIFRWYVVPMATSQSLFNHETSALISTLIFSLKAQKEVIKQLQKEINEMRKANV